MANVYESLAEAIIKYQEEIVGPVAWIEAKKVIGLVIRDHNVDVEGDGKKVLESLVEQYSTLFGRASIEVCREAVKALLQKLNEGEIPKVLL